MPRLRNFLASAKIATADEYAQKRISFLETWLEQAELAVKVLNAYEASKNTPSDQSLNLNLVKAKDSLDKYRLSHVSELGLANLPFINRLEQWAGWRKPN